MNILLVEPDFPIPAKSKNHKNFLPIGLLKIASYLRNRGDCVKLIQGIPTTQGQCDELKSFNPSQVWVTTLFTYWSAIVRSTVTYYRSMFPTADIIVGGIFASLFREDAIRKITGCNHVHKGVLKEVEAFFPAYDLVEEINGEAIDFQIIHASRGCLRQCSFCGTWRIEPKFIPQRTIKNQIRFKKLVFYDNNFLMNPYAEDILDELIQMREGGRITWCEAQSGFDGRLLIDRPDLAAKIRQAGFRDPRIAWDGQFAEHETIARQIELLIKAGYRSKEIFLFMVYNWDLNIEEMEAKRIKCWEWKVQISDCRFRPLNQLFDNYNPIKRNQTAADYYIHETANWSDANVKQFRKNVREQNICVRQQNGFYSKQFERKHVSINVVSELKQQNDGAIPMSFLRKEAIEFWMPDEIRLPKL